MSVVGIFQQLSVSNSMMKSKTCILLVFLLFTAPSVVQGSKTVRAITSVSHLTHHGRGTRETRIHVMLDHTYYLELVNQTQTTARPNCSEFMGVLSRENFQRITSLMQSPTFQSLRTPQAFVQAGSLEAWYVAVRRKKTQFLAFSGRSTPPAGIVAWFGETKNLNPSHRILLRSDYKCSFFSEEMAEAWSR
jgi:hypothetical protein